MVNTIKQTVYLKEEKDGKETGIYDIVIGPVADDRVYRVVVEYENGDIDIPASFIYELANIFKVDFYNEDEVNEKLLKLFNEL